MITLPGKCRLDYSVGFSSKEQECLIFSQAGKAMEIKTEGRKTPLFLLESNVRLDEDSNAGRCS